MNWIKANWRTIMWAAIAVAALILLWILFHPAPTPNDHSGEKKTVDSLISVISTLKKSSNAQILIDSGRIITAERKTDSLKLVSQVWYARAKTNEASAKYYSLLYSQAKEKQDTGASFAACNQIIEIVDSQALVINTLKTIGDSLEVNYHIQLNNKDSIIQTTQILLKMTDNALTNTNKAYQGLNSDYGKEVKANKTNRTLARVLALTTIILGGTVYLLAK